jgi:hypothetical protein
LEEGVVNDVAFTVFSANDPIAALDVAEAKVSGNGLVFLALRSVNKQGAAGAKCTHHSSAGELGRHELYFTWRCIRRDEEDRKGFVKTADRIGRR